MASEPDDPVPGWLAALALAGLIGWIFVSRYRYLAGSPYPFGIDGYWYAIQLRSLTEHGHLYYPAAPLALWLMAPLAWLRDPIVATKLGAAAGSALLAWPVYLIARRATGSRAAGLFGAVLVATSAEAAYLATEFVKNEIGLGLALGAVAALGAALARPSRGRGALAAALVVAALLAHKQALALALGFAAPPLVVRARARGLRISRRGVLGVLVAAAALIGLGVGFPERFVSARDLGLLGRLFEGHVDLRFPVLVTGPRVLLFGHEVVIAGALGLGVLGTALWAWRRAAADAGSPSARDRAFVLGPALFAFFLAIPCLAVDDTQGLGFRLRLVAFVPMALCGAVVAAAVVAWLGRIARLAPATRAALVCGFAAGLAVYRSPRYDAPVVRVDPRVQEAIARVGDAVPEGDVIVTPERHLVFMTAWYARREVRLSAVDVPPERGWRLIPNAYMSAGLAGAIDRVRGAAPILSLTRGSLDGIVLMREPTWQVVLGELVGGEREYYSRWPTY